MEDKRQGAKIKKPANDSRLLVRDITCAFYFPGEILVHPGTSFTCISGVSPVWFCDHCQERDSFLIGEAVKVVFLSKGRLPISFSKVSLEK